MKNLLKLFAVTTLALGAYSSQASTLEDVKAKGHVTCGVSQGLAGFSSVDSNGKWTGFDVDFCRSVAAATLGDAKKVKFVPLTAKERFVALSSGEIDILARNTTWTITRDTTMGLNFAGVSYYDGQGFMVKKSLGVNSVNDLEGAVFCIQAGTTTELNLADYFRSKGMAFTTVAVETSAQTKNGFEANRCDALTSDASQLAAVKSQLKDPSSAVILPELISKEPLGPVVRQGDDQWFNIVKWTLNALIAAEELDVSSKNIYSAFKDPEIGRLLGATGNLNEGLGLDKKWAFNIISQIGNYSEVFERNLNSLGLSRGLNASYKDGGIIYSPPFN